MTDKRRLILVNESVRQRAIQAIKDAPDGYVVTIQEPTRNLEQNAALWVLLQAFSEQLKWPVNGELVHMSPEDWKHVLTAALRNETGRLAMGLNGGVVMLGARTSKMSKREFSDLLEFIQAVAAERQVKI
jgi:hypothetical protein